MFSLPRGYVPKVFGLGILRIRLGPIAVRMGNDSYPLYVTEKGLFPRRKWHT